MQKQRILLLFFTIHLLSCKKLIEIKDPIKNQKNETYLIEPKATDPAYSTDNEQHYVLETNENNNGKLLLFIGGSFSTPKNYSIFCEYVASLGFDVISLSYPNDVAAAPLGNNEDKFIFDKYREEICFGTELSDAVKVNALNSIITRTEKLVLYLEKIYPAHGWKKYLLNSKMEWSKVVVAGHSQGSGHAAYIGKKILTERVIMLSGPNDFHTFYKTGANWLKLPAQTPNNKQFALFHISDEILPLSNQLTNLQTMNLLKTGENLALIEKQSAEKDYRNCMSINVLANSNHSATVGSNSILTPIWKYMLTAN